MALLHLCPPCDLLLCDPHLPTDGKLIINDLYSGMGLFSTGALLLPGVTIGFAGEINAGRRNVYNSNHSTKSTYCDLGTAEATRTILNESSKYKNSKAHVHWHRSPCCHAHCGVNTSCTQQEANRSLQQHAVMDNLIEELIRRGVCHTWSGEMVWRPRRGFVEALEARGMIRGINYDVFNAREFGSCQNRTR